MRNELLIGYDGDEMYYIDTIEGLDVNITKNIYSIEDPSKRLSDFTKTVSIPGSKNNDDIFKSLFDVNFHIRDAQQLNPDFNPAKKAACQYIQDQVVQINGYCQLESITVLEENKVTYQIVIYGQNSDLYSKLGTLTLNDITGFGNFDYTDTDIQTSWTTPNDGSGSYYPLMDRGKIFTLRNGSSTGGAAVDYNSFKPWWFCYEIFSLIMSNAGIKWTSNFITSSLFKSLIIESDMSKFVIDPVTQANDKASVILNTLQANGYNAGSLSLIYNTDNWIFGTVVQDNLLQYNPANGTITVDHDGYWMLQWRYFFQIDLTGSTNKEITTMIILKRAGVYSLLASNVQTDNSTYMNGSFTVSYSFLAGDEIRMCNGTAKSGGVPVATTSSFLTGLLPMEFDFYPQEQIPYGATTSVASVLPPMKQTDFVMGLFKMFNMYMEADVYGEYTIEPRDDYFTEDVIDWTTKLDTSKDVVIKPEGLLKVKELQFNYVRNDDDVSQIFYESVGQTFGYRRKIFDNDFVKDVQKVDVPFICEPLQYYADKEWVIMRTQYSGQGGERSPKPMIAFAGGLLDCVTYRYYDAGLSTYTNLTQYAYAGFLDTPLDTVANDLCFGEQDLYFHTTPSGFNLPVQGDLYSKYHYRQWAETSDRDSKYVECYMKLNAYDIGTVSFRKLYWIENAAYRLLEIQDYNPEGTTTTLCKFLKINLVDSLVVTVSTTVGNGNSNGDITGGGGVDHFGGPGGDGMRVAQVLNGVWQGGNNNIVNKSVGVLITGNDNQVGSNCLNIQIKGSGNTVFPGLSNVTLINCSNLEIQESDVLYIDNIKVVVDAPLNGQTWTYNGTTNQIEFITNQFIDLNFFLFKTASDIGGYYKMLTSPSTGTSQNITIANCSGTTLIAEFATEPSIPGNLYLPIGMFKTHFHAKRTNGGTATIYAEIYKRDSGGTETLLATTPATVTTITTTIDEYGLEIYNPAIIILLTSDRLVIKYYTVVTVGTPDIGIYIEDAYLSRVEFFAGVPATGITEFTQLTDVPSSYTGEALKVVRVNAGETALEFATIGALTDGDKGDITVSGSGATWTIDSTAITGKTLVPADVLDNVLISDVSDAGNLKKATVQSIIDLVPASGLTQQQIEGLI